MGSVPVRPTGLALAMRTPGSAKSSHSDLSFRTLRRLLTATIVRDFHPQCLRPSLGAPNNQQLSITSALKRRLVEEISHHFIVETTFLTTT
jgi:hypothetical protein